MKKRACAKITLSTIFVLYLAAILAGGETLPHVLFCAVVMEILDANQTDVVSQSIPHESR